MSGQPQQDARRESKSCLTWDGVASAGLGCAGLPHDRKCISDENGTGNESCCLSVDRRPA